MQSGVTLRTDFIDLIDDLVEPSPEISLLWKHNKLKSINRYGDKGMKKNYI